MLKILTEIIRKLIGKFTYLLQSADKEDLNTFQDSLLVRMKIVFADNLV